jgi:coenzyme F420-reducing hydrogenase beta subunit
MITITDKTQCCGCWACENICPKQCITMKEDNEGFRYPEIDLTTCINCGLCEKVCPIKQPQQDGILPLSYVIQHKDSNILRTSTSGGFFTAIAKYAISNNGIVFGAAFDKNMELCHQYSETLEGCAKFKGSKYVQSIIGNAYTEAKKFLEEGRLVVFSGTPCQIAGLYGYLKNKNYSKLITVDLVCRGTPSPKLLRKYLSYHAEINNSKVINYRSRDKYYGYNFSTASIWFKDKNKEYHKGMEADIMLRLYFKNICSRPSCYNCHFKTIQRISDFTIFDCWDAPSVSNKFSDKGATNVFIHTKNGEHIFELLKNDFIWNKSDIKSIIKRDGIMIKNVVPINAKRSDFFNDLNNIPIPEIEKKYLNCSFLKRGIANIKPILYRMGIFNLYMKFKR